MLLWKKRVLKMRKNCFFMKYNSTTQQIQSTTHSIFFLCIQGINKWLCLSQRKVELSLWRISCFVVHFPFFWREGRSLKIGFVKRVIFYAVYNNIWCWCEKWFGSLMLWVKTNKNTMQYNTIEWKILFLSLSIYFSKVWSKRNALTSSIYRNGFTQVAHHAF